MTDIFIVSGARTAIGTFGSSLASFRLTKQTAPFPHPAHAELVEALSFSSCRRARTQEVQCFDKLSMDEVEGGVSGLRHTETTLHSLQQNITMTL
jgi:hypothetical protein